MQRFVHLIFAVTSLMVCALNALYEFLEGSNVEEVEFI